MGRHVKKKPPSEKEEKLPSPKPREHPRGGRVDSDSNLDFLGGLATEVDTIVWATIDSGAATTCLPKEMCQTLDLAVKPVEEKPFTNASGQPVQVHGTCNPMVTIGEKGGPQVSGVGHSGNGCGKAIAICVQASRAWAVTFGPQGSQRTVCGNH